MSTAAAVARRPPTNAIVRPLKILIPLIREDVENGQRAGMQYYADAGDKLIEAKSQVGFGGWGRWLSKNFALAERQAQVYMRLARLRADAQNRGDDAVLPNSLYELEGREKSHQARKKHERPLRAALQDLDTDLFSREKQTRDEEIRLHREMAIELIDVGFKALATRLHPDRGGSKDAMARLNRVRETLKGFAEKRKFV